MTECRLLWPGFIATMLTMRHACVVLVVEQKLCGFCRNKEVMETKRFKPLYSEVNPIWALSIY